MPFVRTTTEQIRREGGGQVDHDFLNALTDADIERMAEAEAEEHGLELPTYEELSKRGRIVYPENQDDAATTAPDKDDTPST